MPIACRSILSLSIFLFILCTTLPAHARCIHPRDPRCGRSPVVLAFESEIPPASSSVEKSQGVGQQITLGSGLLIREPIIVTAFAFDYVVLSPATVTVSFYENDGPGGAPGTILFASTPVNLSPGLFKVATLSGLSVRVPHTFTWVIAGGGSLIGSNPPTIGSTCNCVWSYTNVFFGWTQQSFQALGARVWVRTRHRIIRGRRG